MLGFSALGETPLGGLPDETGVTGTGSATVGVVGAGQGSHGVSGAGQGKIEVIGSGEAVFTNSLVHGVGAGSILLSGEGNASHGVSGLATGSIAFSAAGAAAHGVAGAGGGAINVTAVGVAAHGVAGVAAGGIPLIGAGAAIHERYELRGEVREGGVLVNRRVRAYLRSTGALVGEADTVVGKFNVNAGFSQAEHYVIPIDLGEFASDWLPPAANRIVPVLAYDLA